MDVIVSDYQGILALHNYKLVLINKLIKHAY